MINKSSLSTGIKYLNRQHLENKIENRLKIIYTLQTNQILIFYKIKEFKTYRFLLITNKVRKLIR